MPDNHDADVAGASDEVATVRKSPGDRNAEIAELSNRILVLERLISSQEQSSRRLRLKHLDLEQRLFSLENSLAYRLGRAITRNLKPPIGWFRIPGSLLQAAIAFKREGRSIAEGQSSLRDRLSTIDRSVLWQAQLIADLHGPEAALEFARASLHPAQVSALRLLKANTLLDDDEQWLAEVNSYLSQFEMAPIDLESKDAPRFDRLISHTQREVKDGPLVTVIMPVFNAESTLPHAIQSILHQTWRQLELIVVDDRSTDHSLEIAEEIARSDDRLKILVNAVNVGPYVSKNRALKIAQGYWITGHDSDDWAHPERIERQVNEMQANPDKKASIGQMIRIERNGRFSHFSKVGNTSPDGVLRLASISLFIEAAFLRSELGYWDSVRFGGDSEMIERCRTVLRDGFLDSQVLTMMCLDAEQSLTNHPLHGVSKLTGVSAVRQQYREHWHAWHLNLAASKAYLDFPQLNRKFDAPPEILVPDEDIRRLDI